MSDYTTESGWWTSVKFEASLVYKASSGIARAVTQRNAVLKKPKPKKQTTTTKTPQTLKEKESKVTPSTWEAEAGGPVWSTE